MLLCAGQTCPKSQSSVHSLQREQQPVASDRGATTLSARFKSLCSALRAHISIDVKLSAAHCLSLEFYCCLQHELKHAPAEKPTQWQLAGVQVLRLPASGFMSSQRLHDGACNLRSPHAARDATLCQSGVPVACDSTRAHCLKHVLSAMLLARSCCIRGIACMSTGNGVLVL